MGSPAVVKREHAERTGVCFFNADLYLATAIKHREGLWDTPMDDIIAEVQKGRR